MKLSGRKLNFTNKDGVEREITVILEPQDEKYWKEFLDILSSKLGAKVTRENYN